MERFGALSPILVAFKDAKLDKIVVDVVEVKRTSHDKPLRLI